MLASALAMGIIDIALRTKIALIGIAEILVSQLPSSPDHEI